MASNAELIAQAEKLAAELGKDAKTDGLNNAQLGSLVRTLTAEAEAKAPRNGNVTVILNCTYGDKGQGDLAKMPKAQAEKAVASGWAKFPEKD